MFLGQYRARREGLYGDCIAVLRGIRWMGSLEKEMVYICKVNG